MPDLPPLDQQNSASSSAGGRFGEVGVTGLLQWGGRIYDEWLIRLQGERGRRVYREMMDNDPTIGAILFAVEMLFRKVKWRVEPFSQAPNHLEEAEFVKTLPDDMSHTWSDFMAEISTMLGFGFAPFEIVYKRRLGPQESDPSKRSKYTDGKIGWRKLAPRAQETIHEWDFDEDGGIRGYWQWPPAGGGKLYIPITKSLLFRTTARRGNPEGRSALRNIFVPWWHKKHIQEAEAIGLERDLTGLPFAYAPQEYFTSEVPAIRAAFDGLKKMLQNIRSDEQACAVVPSIFDDRNNRLLEVKLLTSGGQRAFDTTGILNRYDYQIASALLAEFIMLGRGTGGNRALGETKVDLFLTSIEGWMTEIAAVVNRHGISRLYELNGLNSSEPAKMVPEPINEDDVGEFFSAVERGVAAGGLTLGSEDDEKFFRGKLKMPEPQAPTRDRKPRLAPRRPPEDGEDGDDGLPPRRRPEPDREG